MKAKVCLKILWKFFDPTTITSSISIDCKTVPNVDLQTINIEKITFRLILEISFSNNSWSNNHYQIFFFFLILSHLPLDYVVRASWDSSVAINICQWQSISKPRSHGHKMSFVTKLAFFHIIMSPKKIKSNAC